MVLSVCTYSISQEHLLQFIFHFWKKNQYGYSYLQVYTQPLFKCKDPRKGKESLVSSKWIFRHDKPPVDRIKCIVYHSKVSFFCHHLWDNYFDLLDLFVVMSDLYVDLSEHYVDLSRSHLLESKSYPVNADNNKIIWQIDIIIW